MGFLSSIGGIIGTVLAPGVGSIIGSGLGSLGDSLISGNAAQDAANTQAAGANAGTKLQADIYKQNRADTLPFLNTGTAANARLSQYLGLPIDRKTVADQLKLSSPDIFAAPQTRTRTPGSETYNLYGQGTDYLVDGKWVPPDQLPKTGEYSASQNAAIDAELAKQKSSPDYGSLTRPFSMADFQKDPGYEFRLSEGQKAIERSAAARGGLLSGAAVKAATRFGQNTASDEYSKAYDRYNNNQTNLYNRFAGISGTGQTASSNLGTQGQNYANNAATGIQNAADYTASGKVAQQNAWSTGLGGIGNSLGGIFNGSGGTSLPWQSPGNVNPQGGYY